MNRKNTPSHSSGRKRCANILQSQMASFTVLDMIRAEKPAQYTTTVRLLLLCRRRLEPGRTMCVCWVKFLTTTTLAPIFSQSSLNGALALKRARLNTADRVTLEPRASIACCRCAPYRYRIRLTGVPTKHTRLADNAVRTEAPEISYAVSPPRSDS